MNQFLSLILSLLTLFSPTIPNQAALITNTNSDPESFGYDIVSQIDDRIKNASASNGLDLYTSRPGTPTTTPWVRNPDAWVLKGTPLDFTGVSGWNDTKDSSGIYQLYRRGATLISPRHFISATHYPLQVGGNVGFFDQSGNIVMRKVMNGYNIGSSDIHVGLLDSDVPSSIKYYPLIDVARFNELIQKPCSQNPTAWDVPIVVFNQKGQALLHALINNFYSATHNPYISGARAPFSAKIIGGDSGQPGFLILKNQPVLLFTHFSADGGPNLGNYISQINDGIVALGNDGGYRVTLADTSGFKQTVTCVKPTITAITPASPLSGTQVTLTGTIFSPKENVAYILKDSSITTVSSIPSNGTTLTNGTSLTFTLPSLPPRSYSLYIINEMGEQSNTFSFDVVGGDSVNKPPVVSAGPDQTIKLPSPATLSGTAEDADLPSSASLTYLWQAIGSNASSAKINNPLSLTTSVTFSVPGTYAFQLTVSDGKSSSFDAVNVVVNPADTTIIKPTISTISPTNGVQGTVVTVTGTKFSSRKNLVHIQNGSVTKQINGSLSSSGTSFQFTIPALTPGVYSVFVENENGDQSNRVQFMYNATNKAPEVSAGVDQTIKLPITSVDLSGSASDDGLPTGSVLTYLWTGDGANPAPVIFEYATRKATKVTFSKVGVYTLTLQASDGLLSKTHSIKVTVVAADPPPPPEEVNQAPQVIAGLDQTIKLPTKTLALDGTVKDDRLPVNATLTYLWTSDPSTSVTFICATCKATSVTFPSVGKYKLTLRASDGLLASTSDMTVDVKPEDIIDQTDVNTAPQIIGGLDQMITLPVNTVTLMPFDDDDGLPINKLTYSWTVESGPAGGSSFDCSTCKTTKALFSKEGTYTFKIVVSDSKLSDYDTVSIIVKPPRGTGTDNDNDTSSENEEPLVSAGVNQTIQLPQNRVTLFGAASDDGLPAGSRISYRWSSNASNPSGVVFSCIDCLSPTVSFPTSGTYRLTLTASDGVLSSNDYSEVIVESQVSNNDSNFNNFPPPPASQFQAPPEPTYFRSFFPAKTPSTPKVKPAPIRKDLLPYANNLLPDVPVEIPEENTRSPLKVVGETIQGVIETVYGRIVDGIESVFTPAKPN